MPAIRMILEAACGTAVGARPDGARPPPPSRRRHRRCCAGRDESTADVLRSFFDDDAIIGPAAMSGPMVWGISPETPGTGLGALGTGDASRRPGRTADRWQRRGAAYALRSAFEAAGGEVRTKSVVDSIRCEGDRVRGVGLVDGTEIDAPIVVSACNPHDTFLRWLKNPPATARDLVRRWADVPHAEGYESKLDVDRRCRVPRLRRLRSPLGPTTMIAPGLADIDRGAALMARGPGARPAGHARQRPEPARPDDGARRPSRVQPRSPVHPVLASSGGWPDSPEPRRWLEAVAGVAASRASSTRSSIGGR